MSARDAAHELFTSIADRVAALTQAGEEHSLWFSGEDSSFVRFNQGKIRQPGHVMQRYLDVDLARGQRHVGGRMSVSGDRELDDARLAELVSTLRQQLELAPEDPYFLRPDDVRSSETIGSGVAPDAGAVTDEILAAADGLDFVGIFAAGPVFAGYADSRGQRNWFANETFHLDYSVYDRADKAVKGGYAGFQWDGAELATRMADTRKQLAVLKREARTVEPGEYRCYLTPAALHEVFGLLSYGAFGKKSRETRQTPFVKMLEGEARFAAKVTLLENPAEGTGPTFSADGFLKPDRILLFDKGELGDPLVSARSAKEYGVAATGAGGSERPEALELAGGGLARSDVLSELGTGVWVSNLWYTNYSDKKSCRVTGMTRFATFWVEGGEPVAPLNVMRFDDTMYRVLGDSLVDLTAERDVLLDADTYSARSTSSATLPGALVDGFRFTL